MSKRIGDKIFIFPTPPDVCDLCGKVAELRPYGANGELICFECGEKNPTVTKRMMLRILFGEEKE